MQGMAVRTPIWSDISATPICPQLGLAYNDETNISA